MYFNNFSLGSLQIDGSTSGSGWCWNILSCAQRSAPGTVPCLTIKDGALDYN